jgi:hypothetical protein
LASAAFAAEAAAAAPGSVGELLGFATSLDTVRYVKHRFMYLTIGPLGSNELELTHNQMAQKPMLRAEVDARTLRPSHNVEGLIGLLCSASSNY